MALANQYGIDLPGIAQAGNALMASRQNQQLNALALQKGQMDLDQAPQLNALALRKAQQGVDEGDLAISGAKQSQAFALHANQVKMTTDALGALDAVPDEQLPQATAAVRANLQSQNVPTAAIDQVIQQAGSDPAKLRPLLKQAAQQGLSYQDQLAEQDKAAQRATSKQSADTAAATQAEAARHNVATEKTAAQQAATAAAALNKPIVLQPGAQLVRPQTGETVGNQAPPETVPGLTGSSDVDATVPGYSNKPVGQSGLTQASIDQKALTYLGDGGLPPQGRTGMAGIQNAAISNRMAEIAPGGISGNKAQFKALASALSERTGYSAKVDTSLNNAEKGFQQVVDTFQGKVNDHTMPLANAITNAAKYQFSPGDVSAFRAGLTEVANEYQQVFSRGGQVTDAVRGKADSIANGNLSIDDLGKVLTELQAQGAIVKAGIRNEIGQLNQQIKGVARGQSAPPDGSAPKVIEFHDLPKGK